MSLIPFANHRQSNSEIIECESESDPTPIDTKPYTTYPQPNSGRLPGNGQMKTTRTPRARVSGRLPS